MNRRVNHCEHRLARAMDDYCSWMRANGYAASTIYCYGGALKYFQRFVGCNKIPWQKVFIFDTLKLFEKHRRVSGATRGIRGLAYYLYRQGQIPQPITKPYVALPAIYEDYISFCETYKKVNPTSLHKIRRILSALHAYLAQHELRLKAIRIEQIDSFCAVYTAGFKSGTCRDQRSFLRGFLRYLHYSRHVIKRDLAALIVTAPDFGRDNPPMFLRPEEIKQLFGGLCSDSAKNLRCAAMVHLAYTLGLRPKEISRITFDDIGFQKSEISIPARKNTQPIRLPIPEATLKAVVAYVVGARPESKLRQLFLALRTPYRAVVAGTVSHVIGKVVHTINPAASAYWLRHTYAQNLLESGASIFEVKEMLGHDSLQTTRCYLNIHVKLMREVLFDETL